MLVTLTEILKIADERKCAIGSFNTPNMATLKAVLAFTRFPNVFSKGITSRHF